MRFFNTADPVDPAKHYTLPPLSRLDAEAVRTLIAREKYVPAGRWPAAMEKIARLEEAGILHIRRNIRDLRERQLGYEVASQPMRIRLGIQDG
jgi:hypothetical protein